MKPEWKSFPHHALTQRPEIGPTADGEGLLVHVHSHGGQRSFDVAFCSAHFESCLKTSCQVQMASIHSNFARKQVGDTQKRGKLEMRS